MLGQDGQRTLRQARGNVVIAMQPGEFFDQIFLEGDIEAVRGRRHCKVVAFAREGEIEPLEQACRDFGAQPDAEDLLGARNAQANSFALRQMAVIDRLRHLAGLAAADVQNQLGGTLQRLAGGGEIDTTLEAV